ncbi:MAG: response regulator [Calditrichae bacterium]|nr:response regulator [Calditrichia bacterium]
MNKTTENLLIVDDEQLIIQLLQDYFVELGFGVEVAYSAEEALEKLNDGVVFDLVISDINLPGKSGIDLLKIIGELKENLPVVLLTGLKTLDNAISAVQSGAADYITKPFELKSVQQIVDRILKKQHRIHWKEQIFEHITYIKNSFTFKTSELDPGILSKELASILNKICFASQAEIGQYELAFTEILVNAQEHGNLELPSQKKDSDLFKKTEFDELRDKRIKDSEYGDRTIDVIFEADTDLFNFTVRDQGPGFDWNDYIGKAHRLKRVNTEIFGRGFKIIQHISDEVHFNDKGNIITIVKNKPQKA